VGDILESSCGSEQFLLGEAIFKTRSPNPTFFGPKLKIDNKKREKT